MSHTDKHTLGGTAHHDPDTLANINALITGLIGELRDIGVGPLSSRPLAGTAGRMWFATDDLTLYEDNGENWAGTNTWQKVVENFSNDAPVGLAQADSGKRWVVGASPTPGDVFENHEHEIATYFNDGAVVGWEFFQPESGTFACVEGQANAVYEYYLPEGPPVGGERTEGWRLRADQNVGTTGNPSFNTAQISDTPPELSRYLIRREELRQYDFQGSVLTTSGPSEPLGPTVGDRHIVYDGTAVDPWGPANHNKIAIWQSADGLLPADWVFITPQEGWMVWDHQSNEYLVYYLGTWWFRGGYLEPHEKSTLTLSSSPKDFQYVPRLEDVYREESSFVVVDSTLTTPPGGPTDGSKYVVPAGAGAAWGTTDGWIAIWVGPYTPPNYLLSSSSPGSQPGAWKFIAPKEGVVVYDQTNDIRLEYTGAAWVSNAPELHAVSHTDGTDDIQDASAVQKGLINTLTQQIAGDKEFLNALKVALLNSGDEIITTDINGQLQESGVKVTTAPAGGSGFTFVEYAVAPVNPPAGFAWFQAKDANTKTFNYYNGVVTFSVDLSV